MWVTNETTATRGENLGKSPLNGFNQSLPPRSSSPIVNSKDGSRFHSGVLAQPSMTRFQDSKIVNESRVHSLMMTRTNPPFKPLPSAPIPKLLSRSFENDTSVRKSSPNEVSNFTQPNSFQSNTKPAPPRSEASRAVIPAPRRSSLLPGKAFRNSILAKQRESAAVESRSSSLFMASRFASGISKPASRVHSTLEIRVASNSNNSNRMSFMAPPRRSSLMVGKKVKALPQIPTHVKEDTGLDQPPKLEIDVPKRNPSPLRNMVADSPMPEGNSALSNFKDEDHDVNKMSQAISSLFLNTKDLNTETPREDYSPAVLNRQHYYQHSKLKGSMWPNKRRRQTNVFKRTSIIMTYSDLELVFTDQEINLIGTI